MARAAGYAASYEFDDLEEFATEVEGILQESGPVFVCLKVQHGEVPPSELRTMEQAIQELREMLAKA